MFWLLVAAGLRSAIEVKESGLDVQYLEKAKTILIQFAGGINAALGNLDKEDS